MPGGTLPGGTLPGGTEPGGWHVPGGTAPARDQAQARGHDAGAALGGAGQTGPCGRIVGGGEPKAPELARPANLAAGQGASQPVLSTRSSVPVGGGGGALAQRSMR